MTEHPAESGFAKGILKSTEESSGWPLRAIREFTIEFMGSLVPGAFFLMLIVPPLMTSGWALACQLSCGLTVEGLGQWLGMLGDLSGAITVGFFVLSLVVGQTLFRMDPKRPDEISARRIVRRHWTQEDADNWVVKEERRSGSPPSLDRQPDGMGSVAWWWRKQSRGGRVARWARGKWQGWFSAAFMDVQFPYRYLPDYLERRSLGYLAQKVPWYGKPPDRRANRSKTFINVLKARLSFLFPERCGQIIRNEAEIRLAASVWFGARYATWVCWVCVLVVGLTGVLRWLHLPAGSLVLPADARISWAEASTLGRAQIVLSDSGAYLALPLRDMSSAPDVITPVEIELTIPASSRQVSGQELAASGASTMFPLPPALALSGLITLGVLLCAYLFKGAVTRFIHYQRVREVLIVLETAWVASQFYPDLFSGLEPDK
jgi:hypothetical protein